MEIRKSHIAIIVAILALSIPIASVSLHYIGSGKGGSTPAGENASYWIHLDPVSDIHVNDSFVITGTTNLPAGEQLSIGIYSTLMHSGRYPSPRWYREDVVPIQKGSGENNSFTTPLITPMIDIKDPKFYATYPDGTKMTVWVEGEYLIAAEYSRDTRIAGASLLNILANETSPVTTLPVNLPKNNTLKNGDRFPVNIDIKGTIQQRDFSDLMDENPTSIPVIHTEVVNNSEFLTCGWNGNFTESARIFLSDTQVKQVLRDGGEIIGLDYYAPFLRPQYETPYCWKMGPGLILHYNNTKIEYVLNNTVPRIEDVYTSDL